MLHKTLWSLCLLLTFSRLAVCWPKLCFSFIVSKCHPEAKKSQSSWIKASSLPLYWVCGLFKGFFGVSKWSMCSIQSDMWPWWKTTAKNLLIYTTHQLAENHQEKGTGELQWQLSVYVAVGCHTSKSFCIDSLLMDLSKQGLNSDST